MSVKVTVDYIEASNKDSTVISANSCIMKIIEDLERDLHRIDGKIAAICGGEKQSEVCIDLSRRNVVEGKRTADNEIGMEEAFDDAVSGTKTETVVGNVVLEYIENDGGSNSMEREAQDTTSQPGDAESDVDDWAVFVSTRAAFPISKSTIELAAPEAKADFSDNADDDWEDFCRERTAMISIDQSNDTGDDFDSFFSERATMDKYKNKQSKSGKLRRLIRRIFGRH